MAYLFQALRFRLGLLRAGAESALRTMRLAWAAPPAAGGSPEGDEGDGDGDGEGSDDDGEGDGGDGGESDEEDGDKDGEEEDGDDKGDKGGDDDDDLEGLKPGTAEYWKRRSRQNERKAQREREKREAAEKEQKKAADKDKTERQKEIDKAREEGKTEAETKGAEERQNMRLENAVTSEATKGLKVTAKKDGKDVEKTIKFADAEDALLHLEKAIKRGDVDREDIFDGEGKVKLSELREALVDVLREKPHLAAREKPRRVEGGSDAGRGNGSAAAKDLEEMSVDDHLKAVQGRK